jgi:pimeloyl-ACP methyl ester carboxylesterase
MAWYESGGTGARTVLLLHGLGATAAVWSGVERALQERGGTHWVAVDLSGHGGSGWRSLYSVGQLAAELAELVRDSAELWVVGHSLGAYVGLALASRWFAIQVRGVLGLGPKITWTASDLQGAKELAARPIRWYQTEEEAWVRYRRVSGLRPDTASPSTSDERLLARGVVRAEEGWRLAQDPRTFAVGGAPFATLAASSTAPVLLARGEHDSMVSLDELRRYDPQARDISGAGHNAHVEDPSAVVALLEQLSARVAL